MGKAELIRQHLDELVFLNQPFVEQDLAESFPLELRILLGLQRRPQLLRFEITQFHQQIAQGHGLAMRAQRLAQLPGIQITQLLQYLDQRIIVAELVADTAGMRQLLAVDDAVFKQDGGNLIAGVLRRRRRRWCADGRIRGLIVHG